MVALLVLLLAAIVAELITTSVSERRKE